MYSTMLPLLTAHLFFLNLTYYISNVKSVNIINSYKPET